MRTKAGTIVVGVDGSSSSLRAVAWAAEQAAAEHLPLTLVHATHAVTPGYMDAAVVYPQEIRDAMRSEAHEVLAGARTEVQRRAPGVEVQEVFVFADPREVLLEMSGDAALLVLGSRGRGKVRSLVLGSVSLAVARHAGCPVVVHRPGHEGTVRNGILVGADGTEESLPVLEFAYRQAATRGLPLTVLHCFWDLSADNLGGYVVPESTVDPESERLALAESMAGLAEKYPEVAVTAEVARGRTDQMLVRLGERMNLVVVGAHPSGRLSRLLFGSVSHAVVEHASCPVAVVPVSAQQVSTPSVRLP